MADDKYQGASLIFENEDKRARAIKAIALVGEMAGFTPPKNALEAQVRYEALAHRARKIISVE